MVYISEIIEKSTDNPQAELLLVGSFYKSPDLFVSYGNYMRSKYDFNDEATRFFYDCFENMYMNFSQTVDENKVNIFMSQDDMRFKKYRHYGGFKLLKSWMELTDVNDVKNYFNTVKKYSLLREYERMGIPVNKILNHRKFDSWLPEDIYRLIRTKVDKINTVISANKESTILTENTSIKVKSLLIKPDIGIPLPWKIMNKMFRGCRLKKVVFNGFISNEGKSRNLMNLMAYIVLVLDEKFLLLSNEMDEEDLQNCLITTVINNPYFEQYHGIKIRKSEGEIAEGLYRSDKNNKFIYREVNEEGIYTESEEDYLKRVYKESSEYRKILQITDWIDRKKEANLYFKDVGSDYSDQTLEFEIRKHRLAYGIKYCGYDTLKGYRTDDWQTVKQTATKLKELMKEIEMFCWAVFQLTDDTVFTDVFQLSSNNIANAKQIKHVADILMIGKRVEKDMYGKYQYISSDDWGENYKHDLNPIKTYFAIKIDKNRGAKKDKLLLFEIDLDLNTWIEVGYLIKKRG